MNPPASVPLDRLCKESLHLTDTQSYRRLASDCEYLHVVCALRQIQILQFVRDQFRCLSEHLEDSAMQELCGIEKSDQRGNDWTRMYAQLLVQQRSAQNKEVTRPMVVTSFIFATVNGSMQDRLDQFDHPAMQSSRVRQVIDHPRGEYIDTDEATKRFKILLMKL